MTSGPGRCSPLVPRTVRLCCVLAFFLRLFAFGGVALVALLWFGASDDGEASDGGDGVFGAAAAFLSLRGILAAMTGAGLFGAVAVGVLRLPSLITVPLALVGAYAGNRVWRAALKKLRYFDRDHSPDRAALLGREGILTVAAHGAGSPGVVQVILGGVSQEYSALPADGETLPAGVRVLIVRYESASTVVVTASPLLALPPAP